MVFTPCFSLDLTRKAGRSSFEESEIVKKWKSEKVGLVIALILSVLIAACDSATKNSVADEPKQSKRAERIVTDDLERKVIVPTKITRVVSTAPSVTEMIFAAGGGDRLVGVTTFCNYPEEAKNIAKIGDTMNPNMETIVALKPDIVFVSTASQIEAFAKTLDQNGIAVYVMDPAFLDEIINKLNELSLMFGTQEKTRTFIDDLEDRTNKLRFLRLDRDETSAERDKRLGAVTVFVQISNEPLFTIGETAFITGLIYEAGGKSVTAELETAYPKLSKETALALQPDVIILSDSPDNQEPNEVFKNSPAVKSGRVYKINADIISRPGPRLVDALEQIAKLLHPDKFK